MNQKFQKGVRLPGTREKLVYRASILKGVSLMTPQKNSGSNYNPRVNIDAHFVKIPLQLVDEINTLFPKKDVGLQYLNLLSKTDCVFANRKSKGSAILAIPGHMFRNLNYIKRQSLRLDVRTLRKTIENYLEKLEHLQYIEYYFDDGLYRRTKYDEPSKNATMVSITIRDFERTMRFKPTVIKPPKASNPNLQYLNTSGNLLIQGTWVDTYYDSSKNIYDYRPIPLLPMYAYSTPQEWVRLMRCPFDRRAATLEVRRNSINRCTRTKTQAEKFSACEAFLDLLSHCVHNEPQLPLSKNQNVVVFNSSEKTSFRSLAKRWCWDTKTVARFFKNFAEYFEVMKLRDKSGVIILIKCLLGEGK